MTRDVSTLTITPDVGAPAFGRRVVAVGQIAQRWHVGSWSPASITVASVEVGDAIVVVGAYWSAVPKRASTAPMDSGGTLRRELDQGPTVVGISKPPVFAQLYVELDAAPGPHTITPAPLGGPAGDGTLYVIQIRGLSEHRVVGSAENRLVGTKLPEIAVALAEPQPDDLVIAFAGYDNTAPMEHITWRPPHGFTVLASEADGATNVPSSLCARLAPTEAVTWSWSDPNVNVASAVVAALR